MLLKSSNLENVSFRQITIYLMGFDAKDFCLRLEID